MTTPILAAYLYRWSFSILQVFQRAQVGSHRHGALQLTMGIQGRVRMGVSTQFGDAPIQSRAILVGADQPHWLEAEGWLGSLWIEPDSRLGRGLVARYLRDAPIVALADMPMDDLASDLMRLTRAGVALKEASRVRDAVESAVLEGGASAPPLHPALKRAIAHIDGLDDLRVSASALAIVAGVSESHLLHLFGDALGIPLRRFIVWRRVWRAGLLINRGSNVTEAAQRSGFHDSSHMTRAFKQLLDVTPGALAKLRDQITVVDLPESLD